MQRLADSGESSLIARPSTSRKSKRKNSQASRQNSRLSGLVLGRLPRRLRTSKGRKSNVRLYGTASHGLAELAPSGNHARHGFSTGGAMLIRPQFRRGYARRQAGRVQERNLAVHFGRASRMGEHQRLRSPPVSPR